MPGDAGEEKENQGPCDREDGMVPDTFLGHWAFLTSFAARATTYLARV